MARQKWRPAPFGRLHRREGRKVSLAQHRCRRIGQTSVLLHDRGRQGGCDIQNARFHDHKADIAIATCRHVYRSGIVLVREIGYLAPGANP
jgi:hypothetical protein